MVDKGEEITEEHAEIFVPMFLSIITEANM